MRKLPAYGRDLKSRLDFKNPPFLCVICVGATAWNDAKKWKENKDISPLVLANEQDPARLSWPVANLKCVIEWSTGPSEKYIVELVKTLFKGGALTVTVRPVFENLKENDCYYNTDKPLGERWIQLRETIRTYHNPLTLGGLANAA